MIFKSFSRGNIWSFTILLGFAFGAFSGCSSVVPSAAVLPPEIDHIMASDDVRFLKSHYKKDYEFSADMFSSRIPNWKKLFAEYKGKPGFKYLEVGTFEGASFFWMLENVLTHPTARATGVDNFSSYAGIEERYKKHLKTIGAPAAARPPDLEQRFRGNLRISGDQGKVTVLKGNSQDILPRLTEKFDVIYVDGGHEMSSILDDALNAWRVLKTNGIIIFDDYHFREDFPLELRPRLALDSFVTAFQEEVRILFRASSSSSGPGQLILQKIPRRCSEAPEQGVAAFGQYCFDFYRRGLFLPSPTGRNYVALKPEETAMIESLLRAKKIGEVDWPYSGELKKDRVFAELASRLRLELPAAGDRSENFWGLE